MQQCQKDGRNGLQDHEEINLKFDTVEILKIPDIPKVNSAGKGYLARKKLHQNDKVIKVLDQLLLPDSDPAKFWVKDKLIDGAKYNG